MYYHPLISHLLFIVATHSKNFHTINPYFVQFYVRLSEAMPLSRKPTLMFVSGAFHDQDFFEPAIPWLRQTGYRIN
jgi:hypothetical protein